MGARQSLYAMCGWCCVIPRSEGVVLHDREDFTAKVVDLLLELDLASFDALSHIHPLLGSTPSSAKVLA